MHANEELFGTPESSVMDPVHGGIPLFTHELAVLDHHLFQRLRHVVQNDLVFLVFPGARHSRFEHSLGAAHIAGRFVQSVVRSHLVDRHRRKPTEPLGEQDKEAIRYFYWIVRLAALLHDTGHAPFSHQFEHSISGMTLLRDSTTVANLWRGNDWSQYHKQLPVQLTHEHYSVRCAVQLLEAAAEDDRHFPVAAKDVVSLLQTCDCEPTEKFADFAHGIFGSFFKASNRIESTRVVRTFLRQVISGELDVDKMDYMLRDSLYSGSKYGFYNLDHLLNSIRLTFDGSERWLGLGIEEKGLGALEDFVHSRFQLHLNVIHHKTVAGFRWLLREAIQEVFELPDAREQIHAALTTLEDWQYFTDTFFWEQFRRVSERQGLSACARILRRDRLHYVHTSRDGGEINVGQKVRELESALKYRVVFWESDTKFSKLGAPYGALRVVVRNRVTGKRHVEQVRHLTTFFSKFSQTKVVHFFERPRLAESPGGPT